jgi:hypothetical protein
LAELGWRRRDWSVIGRIVRVDRRVRDDQGEFVQYGMGECKIGGGKSGCRRSGVRDEQCEIGEYEVGSTRSAVRDGQYEIGEYKIEVYELGPY